MIPGIMGFILAGVLLTVCIWAKTDEKGVGTNSAPVLN